jgi:PAS domain S-box-containing protein
MEDRFKLLSCAVTSTDDSIYISDMQDKIIFVNRAFCEVYGYKEDEIMGKDSNILWEKGTADHKPKQTYEASSGWEVGFYHKRKDGSQFPVSLTRSAIKDENGQEIALICVARDISEHIRIEDDLRTENLKLKNLLKVYESAEVSNSL